MQQTETYKLNLIETGDAFSPQPMNENMEKVEAVLAELGNCSVTVGRYEGTGEVGTAQEINLGFMPSAVLVIRAHIGSADMALGLAIRVGDIQGAVTSANKPSAQNTVNFYNGYISIMDTGFSVTKYHSSYTHCLNESDSTYLYIAFK